MVIAEEDEQGLVHIIDPTDERAGGRVGEVTTVAEGRISVFGPNDPEGNLRIRLDLRQGVEGPDGVDIRAGGLALGTIAIVVGSVSSHSSSVAVSLEIADRTASIGSVIP